MNELTRDEARTLTSEFEADYCGTQDSAARFLVLEVGASILDRATGLVESHALRAYDAIQLASACAARDADPACDAFACADAALRAAAVAEGFTLVP